MANMIFNRPMNIQNYDNFGEALVVGDFNGNGSVDLAVGREHSGRTHHRNRSFTWREKNRYVCPGRLPGCILPG
jgi:hypothetical protein